MQVKLDSDLFENENNFRLLDKSIHFFEDGKHQWIDLNSSRVRVFTLVPHKQKEKKQ